MSLALDAEETFASLAESVGLDVRLRKAVMRLGHIRPTLVQSKCLPLAISSGRDLLVRARTGSGKTLAYCLPVLQKVIQRKNADDGQRFMSSGGHVASTAAAAAGGRRCSVGAIILVPTRELCTQVYKTLQQLTYYCDDIVSIAVLSVGLGGSAAAAASQQQHKNKNNDELERQEAMLRDQPDVIVATPNALLTHIRRSNNSRNGKCPTLDLKSSVETLVVDEADLILSFGYSNDITEIVKSLPRIYQGMLMSATLMPELESLKKVLLHTPVILKLEQESEATGASAGQLKQFYVALPNKDKNLVLYVFLKLGLLKGKGLFFVNTTDSGYRLKLFFEQFHIRSAVLNAELPFRSRMNIIEQYNIGNFDYLIATDSSTDAGKSITNDEDDDDDESDHDIKDNAPSNNQQKKGRKEDSSYGVSRGLDFRNVSFVLNVDLPPNPRSYAHRIGRTARGGATGVALSLIDINSKEQLDILYDIQDNQPRIPFAGASTETLSAVATNNMNDDAVSTSDQPQPVPLDFNLQEIEGFRYRVEDVSRAITRIAVRETRAAELKAEILNSERLQAHFAENPSDLQLLAHDRFATHVSKVQEHLKHVPKYLLPRGMQVANFTRRKKKRLNKRGRGSNGERRSDNDPLQTFDGDVNFDGMHDVDDDDGGDHDPHAHFMNDADDDELGSEKKKQKIDDDAKVFTSTKDGTGQSTAGRSAWKEKHRKGKFSSKKRLAERKYKQPLGI
jgi:ATP-dependent RNA helicase DDX56/DBP9